MFDSFTDNLIAVINEALVQGFITESEVLDILQKIMIRKNYKEKLNEKAT